MAQLRTSSAALECPKSCMTYIIQICQMNMLRSTLPHRVHGVSQQLEEACAALVLQQEAARPSAGGMCRMLGALTEFLHCCCHAAVDKCNQTSSVLLRCKIPAVQHCNRKTATEDSSRLALG